MVHLSRSKGFSIEKDCLEVSNDVLVNAGDQDDVPDLGEALRLISGNVGENAIFEFDMQKIFQLRYRLYSRVQKKYFIC